MIRRISIFLMPILSQIFTRIQMSTTKKNMRDPCNSLQKESDSNYERETRLKRSKRIQEPSDEDDEPISIPAPILEQIEQEKTQRQNERLSIQQDKEILARREKYLEDAKK